MCACYRLKFVKKLCGEIICRVFSFVQICIFRHFKYILWFWIYSPSLNIGGSLVNTNDAKEVIIPLTGGLTSGNYTLRIGNDVVQDLSTQANKNVAATTTVKVDSSTDKEKPVVDATSVSETPATDQTSGTTIVVNMTDNVGLDLATVQNVNNYLLNDKPLPSGSYIWKLRYSSNRYRCNNQYSCSVYH